MAVVSEIWSPAQAEICQDNLIATLAKEPQTAGALKDCDISTRY